MASTADITGVKRLRLGDLVGPFDDGTAISKNGDRNLIFEPQPDKKTGRVDNTQIGPPLREHFQRGRDRRRGQLNRTTPAQHFRFGITTASGAIEEGKFPLRTCRARFPKHRGDLDLAVTIPPKIDRPDAASYRLGMAG